MANTNVVIDMVAKEAMRLAHEKATFVGTINRSYDDSFAKSGAKIGSTLRIREPNAYSRRTGSRVMDVQDQSDVAQTLTVATQDGVDMRFNSAELALDIDELSKRYIEPAMSVLVSGIDGDCIVSATKATYNTVGTAGTVVGAVTSGFSDTSALGNARAKLNQCLAPKDGSRVLQMDSITMASVANGVKGLFHPSGQVQEAFREGFIARTAMADLYENERTWTVSNSDDVSGNTDATGLGTGVVEGNNTYYNTIDMHTQIAVAKQAVGEVFTIAGVYQCHPETKAAYSHLQQFTITAIGATLTTVSPKIYLTGPKQNVCSAAGAALATTDFDAKAVTPWGSASTSYRQNLMYHRDAYTFVTADLPLMDDAAKCVRITQDGLSLRVWQASDIRNDELLMRIDILYGFLANRAAWGCRVSN